MTSSGKRVMPCLLHFSIFSFGCFRKEWAFFFCLWRVQNSLNPQKKKKKKEWWWVSECTWCCQHVKFVMEGGRGGGEWLLFIDKQQATTTSFIQTIIYDPFIKNSKSHDLTRGDHGKKKSVNSSSTLMGLLSGGKSDAQDENWKDVWTLHLSFYI